jgi:dihydrofolate synthase/folylpolyglutamate synthase
MTYDETLRFLYSQLPMYQRQGNAAYKEDLSNTLVLDNYFEHPHRQFKTIHIAGTNGKGSTSHMLASILQSAGYKVGLYTSPHLKDFRERIKINGNFIPKDVVTRFVEKAKPVIDEIQPSFFELTVLMAFDYFKKEKVDIAVIETGMGGRLDSTNIITPVLSIITTIGFDHTKFLGNTLPKIANEKAGIIKSNIPVVIGDKSDETKFIFIDKAKKENAPLSFATEFFQIDYVLQAVEEYQVFNVKQKNSIVYRDLKLDLLGNYQQKNLLTVLTAIETLKSFESLQISNDAIYEGLSNVITNTGLLGRWQVLSYNPTIVFDVAHNKDGLQSVFSQVANTPYKRLHIVAGFVNDKMIDDILPLFPENAQYYFCEADIPRALPLNDLLRKAKQYNLNGLGYGSVKLAFETAQKNADNYDMILVTGSTFVVAEVV